MGQDECVPLLAVIEAIRMRHGGDLKAVYKLILEAHRFGDLDLRMRRHDGSVTDRLIRYRIVADPWGNPGDPWEVIFRTGLIEGRRIVGTRASLESFLKTMPATTEIVEARAIEYLKGLFLERGDMKKADAQEACEKFNLPVRAFRDRVWQPARKLAGLPPATAGRKSARKSER